MPSPIKAFRFEDVPHSCRKCCNVPLPENTPNEINPQEPDKSEQMTQVQRDNVITNQDLPNPLVRYGFTLVILATFLFVVAIYYGIINP